MAERVKEVAVEEADRLKTLTSDAVRSGAYFYPIRVCPCLNDEEGYVVRARLTVVFMLGNCLFSFP